jgi:Flp pilus assembly protein TadG
MKRPLARTTGTRRHFLTSRSGTATVEFAVCLPMLVLIVLGSLEACSMIFLNQSLHTSAYEGARAAIRSSSTTTLAETRCRDVLTVRSVKSATVTFEPVDVSQAAKGAAITVRVTAPSSGNSILPPWFYAGKTLGATCTMVKE